MRLMIIIGLAVLVAIVIYILVHHEITKHATLIVRSAAQKSTDAAMQACLPVLAKQQLVQNNELNFSQSQTVADVWGRGVMAFEYALAVQHVSPDELQWLAHVLDDELQRYGEAKQIERVQSASKAFVVTDIWLFENKLHFDIAYLMNDATYEYVKDLKKIG